MALPIALKHIVLEGNRQMEQVHKLITSHPELGESIEHITMGTFLFGGRMWVDDLFPSRDTTPTSEHSGDEAEVVPLTRKRTQSFNFNNFRDILLHTPNLGRIVGLDSRTLDLPCLQALASTAGSALEEYSGPGFLEESLPSERQYEEAAVCFPSFHKLRRLHWKKRAEPPVRPGTVREARIVPHIPEGLDLSAAFPVVEHLSLGCGDDLTLTILTLAESVLVRLVSLLDVLTLLFSACPNFES